MNKLFDLVYDLKLNMKSNWNAITKEFKAMTVLEWILTPRYPYVPMSNGRD